MGRRCTGRKDDRNAENLAQENGETVVRAEEMAMCRHVGSVGRGGDMAWQLCRIARLLEEQNGMVAVLLQKVGEQG